MTSGTRLTPLIWKHLHDGNGINGPASKFEVKRKWNGGNGHENRCYGEEYTKFLKYLGWHREVGLQEFVNVGGHKGK